MRSALMSLGVLMLASAASAEAPSPVSGKWAVTWDFYGTPLYAVMTLQQDGTKVSGTYGADKLEGTLQGGVLRWTNANPARKITGEAKVSGGALKGELVSTTPDQSPPRRYDFIAVRQPDPPAGPPRRHEFTPTRFYRQFSADNAPVLRIFPGDTIHTTTVDAGGRDETDKPRVAGGNPETGPFFVETALPGDTLVVHVRRLKLNRDYALSDDAIVPRGLDDQLAVQMKDGGRAVRWKLDRDKGLASLDKPGPHTGSYSLAVRPMLGCVATAPPPGFGPAPTGDSGFFGGNMDFNEIVEGATVYLPVSVPGALLYFGDAHALQGDGEINGNALETSMDVELTVEVIHDKGVPSPRVESDSHIMAMGLAGSLDDAYRAATANLAAWLTRDFQLTPSETAVVIGSGAEYRISEVADRNAGVVAKLSKAKLAMLTGKK